MNIRRFTSSQTPLRVIATIATVAAVTLPLTARTQADTSALQAYRQDRADCLAGKTSESQADCLYEARSVLRDRRAGSHLDPGDLNAVRTSSSSVQDSGGLAPKADRH
jgi:hypothetical protein